MGTINKDNYNDVRNFAFSIGKTTAEVRAAIDKVGSKEEDIKKELDAHSKITFHERRKWRLK